MILLLFISFRYIYIYFPFVIQGNKRENIFYFLLLYCEHTSFLLVFAVEVTVASIFYSCINHYHLLLNILVL